MTLVTFGIPPPIISGLVIGFLVGVVVYILHGFIFPIMSGAVGAYIIVITYPLVSGAVPKSMSSSEILELFASPFGQHLHFWLILSILGTIINFIWVVIATEEEKE